VKVRTVLVATSLLSAILGAVVAYLVLTVPNDLQAGALLKDARQQIASGDNNGARQSLSRIIQQYPRTDAAAAATVALATISDSERQKLVRDFEALRREYSALQKQVTGVGARIQTIENKPAPAPVIIREPAPPPPEPVAKKTTPTKSTPKKAPVKKSTSRKRSG
jgi:hypothetical protein